MIYFFNCQCVTPKRYEVKLDIGNPEDLEYCGQVNIRIYFEATVNTIWLHSKGVEIVDATLQSSQLQAHTPQTATDILEVPEKEVVGIRFEHPVLVGSRAWLGIKFKGEISRSLQGFFSTPFVEAESNPKA